MPGPEDNPYDPINTTESTLDEPPAPGTGDPPRKPVAEYLDYLWSKPAALGNPPPGNDDRSSYFRWLLPPSWT
eukprot:2794116-Heterocapsa_arctica.AAC.1